MYAFEHHGLGDHVYDLPVIAAERDCGGCQMSRLRTCHSRPENILFGPCSLSEQPQCIQMTGTNEFLSACLGYDISCYSHSQRPALLLQGTCPSFARRNTSNKPIAIYASSAHGNPQRTCQELSTFVDASWRMYSRRSVRNSNSANTIDTIHVYQFRNSCRTLDGINGHNKQAVYSKC